MKPIKALLFLIAFTIALPSAQAQLFNKKKKQQETATLKAQEANQLINKLENEKKAIAAANQRNNDAKLDKDIGKAQALINQNKPVPNSLLNDIRNGQKEKRAGIDRATTQKTFAKEQVRQLTERQNSKNYLKNRKADLKNEKRQRFNNTAPAQLKQDQAAERNLAKTRRDLSIKNNKKQIKKLYKKDVASINKKLNQPGSKRFKEQEQKKKDKIAKKLVNKGNKKQDKIVQTAAKEKAGILKKQAKNSKTIKKKVKKNAAKIKAHQASKKNKTVKKMAKRKLRKG